MTRFLKKNLLLLILTLLAFALTKWDIAYAIIGTVLYTPLVVGVASLLYRTVIQIRFAETIEADSIGIGGAPSVEKQDWGKIGAVERARVRAIVRAAFFIGTAILVAAVVGR